MCCQRRRVGEDDGGRWVGDDDGRRRVGEDTGRRWVGDDDGRRWLTWRPNTNWAIANATVAVIALGFMIGRPDNQEFLYFQF